MTLDLQTSRVVFKGNGAAVEFPFDFKVWDASQIAVFVSDDPDGINEMEVTPQKVILTESGGTVTYTLEGKPLPEGYTLSIVRNMPFIQEDMYITGTRFNPEVIETRFDKDCAERQQILEMLSRCIKVSVTSGMTPEQLLKAIFKAYHDILESLEKTGSITGAIPVVATGTTEPRPLKDRFADIVNVKDFGAVGDGETDDTDAFEKASALGDRIFVPDGVYVVSGPLNVSVYGNGFIKYKNTTSVVPCTPLHENYIVQNFIEKVYTNKSNATTQALCVFNGKLYRTQDGKASSDKYSFENTTIISEYDLVSQNKDRIDYSTYADAIYANYSIELQGMGHGDGFNFLVEDGVTYVYAHCCAPAGSSDADTEARGYCKFPWLGNRTSRIPEGIVFYRDLQKVENGNFCLSADGKYCIFVQSSVIQIAGMSGKHTQLSVTVHDRKAIESASDPTRVPAVSNFLVQPVTEQDTNYSESGICSDGKYIYFIASGARVGGIIIMYVYTIEGNYVTHYMIDGARAISYDYYEQGFNGWFPQYYEIEGLTYYNGNIIMASRYTFTYNPDIVSFFGHNFACIADTKGHTPLDFNYWALTKAAPTKGEYDHNTQYHCDGPAVANHLITAISNKKSDDSFAVNKVNIRDLAHYVVGPFVSRRDIVFALGGIGGTQFALAKLSTDGTFRLAPGKNFASGEYSNVLRLTCGNDVRFGTDQSISSGGSCLKFLEDTDGARASILYVAGQRVFLYKNNNVDIYSPQFIPRYDNTTKLGNNGRFWTHVYSKYYRAGIEITPSVDNEVPLGRASYRFSQLFAGTSEIATSDIRSKQKVEPYSDALLDAWGDVELRQYLFNDSVDKKGDAARIHAGIIAQQVITVFEKHGLDAKRYALLCYDEWEDHYEDTEVVDKEAVFNENGVEVESAVTHTEKKLMAPAGNRYGIRYSEALCLEAAYQRRRADRIEARLAALEKKLGSV